MCFLKTKTASFSFIWIPSTSENKSFDSHRILPLFGSTSTRKKCVLSCTVKCSFSHIKKILFPTIYGLRTTLYFEKPQCFLKLNGFLASTKSIELINKILCSCVASPFMSPLSSNLLINGYFFNRGSFRRRCVILLDFTSISLEYT